MAKRIPVRTGAGQTVYGSDGTTFKNEDKCIDYLRAGGKVSTAFLVITRDIYPCGGTCWGIVSGKGLAPNATVNLNKGVGTGLADANGNFAAPLNLSCGSNWTGIVATSTTASGKPITSNTVNTPCG
jgi:hypothetical protein